MMGECAIWRRLDTPGHDAARLTMSGAGHLLRGAAVFETSDGPACLNYSVEVDRAWRTRLGRVRGFLADRTIDHVICRTADGWYVDDRPLADLGHLWDLDFGFTPATNLLQLRRRAPGRGEPIDLPVAWFDIDAGTVTELPQRYERVDDMAYRYEAPSVPYEGLLELAANGFVRNYPQLWAMEA